MKQQSLTRNIKRFAVLLHVIFACATLIGIGFMYLNVNYGRGLSWIHDEDFEQSPAFNKKIQSDITSIFDYLKYQEIFETGGSIDYNRVVLEVTSGPGGDISYTLKDIIRYGKHIGYYMDEDNHFQLRGQPVGLSEEDNQKLFVKYRCYQDESELSGPDQSYATLPDLTYEILTRFSSYYSFYDRLLSDFTNFYFRVAYYSKNASIYKVTTNAPKMSTEDMMAMGKYIYYSGNSSDMTVQTNFNSTFPSIPELMAQNNPYNSTDYYIVIGLDTSYKVNDDYAQAVSDYSRSRDSYKMGVDLVVIGLLGSITTILFLITVSGHSVFGDRTVSLYPIDKMKTEFMLVLMFLFTVCCASFLSPLFSKIVHLVLEQSLWEKADQLVLFGTAYFCILLTFFSLVRRYKAETLWENSFFHQMMDVLSESSFRYRLTISYIVFLGYNIFAITIGVSFLTREGTDAIRSLPFLALVLLWFTGNLIVFYYLYYNAGQQDMIHDAIDKLASGETSYKTDTSKFSSLEAELAEGINRISEGLETALAEQVKSERLKADLITNVSHDIKTPLTSIINYVDLIKREKIDNPNVNQYLEVLDQKSQRLKNLTEDLVEASKASSGNIKLEIADIDLIELVQQTNGEFEDRCAIRHLELVSTLPNEVILIEADGRRLWRVLENLYNNAFKYAMEHTRIYIGVEDRGTKVVFSIKNVSSSPLNISPEELTERFVRGDVSRTTEGSGLGLSIAKSLTELQGGSFDITIDGDLFKVELAFDIKN